MRARTEGSARQIEEAKKRNMLVIDDTDEMLAAAEAIPVRCDMQFALATRWNPRRLTFGSLEHRVDHFSCADLRCNPRHLCPFQSIAAAGSWTRV